MSKYISVILGLFVLCSSVEGQDLRYCSSGSIWSHAAYLSDTGRIDLTAVRSRIDSGFCGVEVDVIFDEAERKFYVAHDPLSDKDQRKKRQLVDVSKILSERKAHIWLDWKNASVFNANLGLSVLLDTFRTYIERGDYLIVETPNISASLYMNFLNLSGIQVLHWVGYGGKGDSLRNIFRDIRTYVLYCYTEFWISTPSANLVDVCQRRGGRLFVFTVNNMEEIGTLLKKGVSVVLTDLPFETLKEHSLH